MPRGKYIMIEGGEGCGKDTQGEILYKHLTGKGHQVFLTREPGGTPGAEEIRSLVKNPNYNFSPEAELAMFETSRALSYSQIILPKLENGIHVIKTRGWPSTEAYQGHAGGLDLKLIRKLNREMTLEIKPDILFIIDVDPKVGLEMEVEKDRFGAKGLDYHKKVNRGFLKVAKDYKEISVIIPYMKDASALMQKEIQNRLKERFSI